MYGVTPEGKIRSYQSIEKTIPFTFTGYIEKQPNSEQATIY